jgi:hypothetical protein
MSYFYRWKEESSSERTLCFWFGFGMVRVPERTVKSDGRNWPGRVMDGGIKKIEPFFQLVLICGLVGG